jgi:hypothetical protein
MVAAAIAAMFRAGAILAATGAPGAIVVTAAFGTDRAMMRFAADEAFTTVEL